jgi:hypothetical protein
MIITYKLEVVEGKINLVAILEIKEQILTGGTNKICLELLHDIVEKRVDGIKFYHEIPSLGLKVPEIIMYYCQKDKDCHIISYLEDLYADVYDFMNVREYVDKNITLLYSYS